MNMNKALQNLYHAVSNETTTKVNISKLLVDIHYAITGKESENKNNWSKIVNSMADNWPEGGGSGGSSDFSTATVTVTFETAATLFTPYCYDYDGYAGIDVAILESDTYTVALYKGAALASVQNGQIAGTGNIKIEGKEALITGDCTITIS